MASIIQLLFSSNITFPVSWKEDSTLGNLSESVQRFASQLHAAQPELWDEYQTQAEELHNLERQIEFERGFVIAAQLMVEIIKKVSEG